MNFVGFNDCDLTNSLILWGNGDLGLFFSDAFGFKYRLYDAGMGAWQTAVIIDSGGNQHSFGNAIYDRASPDPAYLVYFTVSPANPILVTVSKTGTVTTQFTYPTGGGWTDGCGHMCISGGSLFAPIDQSIVANPDRFYSNVWDAPLNNLSTMTRRPLPKLPGAEPTGDGTTPPTCNFMIFGQINSGGRGWRVSES